jgi:triacylglycerol lipase
MGPSRFPPVRRLVLVAAAALGLTAAAPSAASAAETPTQADRAAAAARAEAAANAAALTACRPSAAHPYPVVLVHGTFGSASDWDAFAAQLRGAGYCAYALDYGNHGTGPIEQSARQLAAFVDGVLAVTGAARVAFVGHSQGGMMPRYYLRFLGGAARTAALVGLAPSNHGTTNPLVHVAGLVCAACDEQEAGSAFLARLNAGHDVEPGIGYTVIATRFDEVVLPYRSQFLAGDPAQVTDVTVQSRCPFDLSGHVGIRTDRVAVQWVMNALARGGVADPGFRPAC